MKEQMIYFDLVMLLERLHRLFIEVLKNELKKLNVRDITPIQSIILYNLRKGQLTVGEIGSKGYYLGSNVSYNLKKMIENGYILHEQSTHDKRTTHIRLSSKGLKLYEKIEQIMQQQFKELLTSQFDHEDLEKLLDKGQSLEVFWNSLLTRTL